MKSVFFLSNNPKLLTSLCKDVCNCYFFLCCILHSNGCRPKCNIPRRQDHRLWVVFKIMQPANHASPGLLRSSDDDADDDDDDGWPSIHHGWDCLHSAEAMGLESPDWPDLAAMVVWCIRAGFQRGLEMSWFWVILDNGSWNQMNSNWTFE